MDSHVISAYPMSPRSSPKKISKFIRQLSWTPILSLRHQLFLIRYFVSLKLLKSILMLLYLLTNKVAGYTIRDHNAIILRAGSKLLQSFSVPYTELATALLGVTIALHELHATHVCLESVSITVISWRTNPLMHKYRHLFITRLMETYELGRNLLCIFSSLISFVKLINLLIIWLINFSE